jgi:hypothetical protein
MIMHGRDGRTQALLFAAEVVNGSLVKLQFRGSRLLRVIGISLPAGWEQCHGAALIVIVISPECEAQVKAASLAT